MFLDYFALGVLIFVFLVIFYGIIILHDIPYLIAKKRNFIFFFFFSFFRFFFFLNFTKFCQ